MKKILGSKAWDIVWITCGEAALLYCVYKNYVDNYAGQSKSAWDWFLLFIVGIGSILAPLIVNLMANQKAKLATGLGTIGAVLDAINYFSLGIVGSCVTAVWAFITYLKGFITYRKKSLEVSKVSRKNLIISLVVAIVGSVIAFFLGGYMTSADPVWFKICNILLIFSMLISQYLLIEGNSASWFAWIVTNVFQIITTAYPAFVLHNSASLGYFVVSIMFIINSVKGAVLWYKPSGKESKDEKQATNA